MPSKYSKRKGLKRSALAMALGVCFAGSVQAQSSAGAITGHAQSGDTITIENPNTGFSRTITASGDGSYRFSALPAGPYTVTRKGADGTTASQSTRVSIGTASSVDFAGAAAPGATTLDTITVLGSGLVNPIDVSSVESTTILTAEQIKAIPVAADTTSVALLAPGTVKGDAAFGNLASFGGSSVAENQYYVNGFNITNTYRNLNFATIPFEAVAEQQIKTGGYGAEFGRSLGGVVNQITKRGTNEFHAGGNVYFSPKSLREDVSDTYYSNPLTPDVFGTLRQDNSHDSLESMRANVWASGALIKDRLFAYGIVSWSKEEEDVYNSVLDTGNTTEVRETPNVNWLLKMDWNITDNHLLEFTAFSDESEETTDSYLNDTGSFERNEYLGANVNETGGDNYILRYTGYLTDTFTLSALAGRSKYSRAEYLISPDGEKVFYTGDFTQDQPGCPIVNDSRPAYRQEITGSYFSPCNISGGTIERIDSEDTREQFRLDAEWIVGDHRLRAGYDRDDYESVAGASREGGFSWTYGTDNQGAPFTDDQDFVTQGFFAQGSTVKVEQHAYYIEDYWNITDNFIAYFGGRWDTFRNLQGNGDAYVEIENQFGPRLGFSWDVFGDSTFKVFGNAGRYALPLTPSVAVRGASASLFTTESFTYSGVDENGEPINPVSRGDFRFINAETGNPHIASTVASQNLDPMYQDEFILGFQKQLSDNFTIGTRGIFRELKAAIDDNCDYTAVLNSPGSGFTYDPAVGFWVDEAGNLPALPNEGFPYCRMFNPGEDAVFLTDFYGDGNLTEVTVPGELLSPPAKRTYTAIEFFFDGKWDNFFFQGSYTYAKSKGNTEGGVKSDIGQNNTNVTQDFDYLELTVDTFGYLPNDRRHSLKLFGSYDFTDEWAVGANVLVQSGRPLNCFGSLDLNTDPPVFDAAGNVVDANFQRHPYNSSFMRCGTTTRGGLDDATVEAFPRGTKGRLPWTSSLDLNVIYRPNWVEGLRLQMDVFNVLNSQKVTSVDETAEISPALGAPDPLYLVPISFQQPRSVRFLVQYDF